MLQRLTYQAFLLSEEILADGCSTHFHKSLQQKLATVWWIIRRHTVVF
jgi:hypothetical protein